MPEGDVVLRWKFPEKLERLFDPHRYKVLYGGRGGAKSWGVARALLIKGTQQPLRVLCAREIQLSLADSVHKLLSDQIIALGLEAFYRVQTTSIFGTNGTEFSFSGIRQQDVAKIKSYEGVDVCWVEEAQTVTKKSWDILIPTIRKEDSEIWVTFNPDLDSDDTYTRFVEHPPPDALIINIGFEDNPWFPLTLEKERLHLLQVDPESYDNVWLGKPKTVVDGAIYKNEIIDLFKEGRVRLIPHDPALKVHCIWDLGWNDASSIIMVQKAPGSLMVIDYLEDSHRTYASYIAELRERKYNWGSDFLPHDAEHKDPKEGQSAVDVFRKLGRNVQVIKLGDIELGIKRARMTFPKCYFDTDKTKRLLDCLKRYRRSIPISTNEPGAPLHDEYSHGADAFRYLAMAADRLKNDDVNFRGKLEYVQARVV